MQFVYILLNLVTIATAIDMLFTDGIFCDGALPVQILTLMLATLLACLPIIPFSLLFLLVGISVKSHMSWKLDISGTIRTNTGNSCFGVHDSRAGSEK